MRLPARRHRNVRSPLQEVIVNSLLVVSAFVMVSIPALASGETPATCAAYAREAVASQRLNQARRCELTGDPWSLNESGHYQWCLGQSAAALQRENQNRSSHLQTCEECTVYAHTAVDAQRANIARGCGFRGDMWSDNERGHYRWCTAQTRPAVRGWHTARRDELLNSCRR
jgi:hypothetical protein